MKKILILKVLFAATFCATLIAQPVIDQKTPPAELQKYETQLFKLLDRSEKTSFDLDISQAFNSLLKKAPVADPKLANKLLSGPAPKGRYVNVEGTQYFYYTACQAHWCSSTNLAMLFNPTTKDAIGILSYRCRVYFLNIASESQKRLFDSLDPRSIDPKTQKEICEEAKASNS